MYYTGDTNKYAVWNIYGEDSNAEINGNHVCPFLGKAEGRYCDVLEYAESLTGWFAWGDGGYLTEAEQIKVVKIIPHTISQERLEKIKSLNIDGFKYNTTDIAKVIQKALQSAVKTNNITVELRCDNEVDITYYGDSEHGSQKFNVKVIQELQ